MATDDKVAFYLRHRTLIEEWAALREQAAAELEEALSRAVGIIGQRPETPEIVEFDSDRRHPMYGISLQIPGAESGTVWVALGWARGQLLRPGGESWPYMGIKIPGATRGEAGHDTVKRLADATSRNRRKRAGRGRSSPGPLPGSALVPEVAQESLGVLQRGRAGHRVAGG
jgi:hypothetical protein